MQANLELDRPWLPQPSPRTWRSFFFAVLMHAVLVALVTIGIQWRTETPIAVEAELWSAVPQFEAPAPVKSIPVPPTVLTPAPTVAEKPVALKPDIALEAEKKKEQQRKERVEREVEQQREQQRQVELQKKQQEEKKKEEALEKMRKADAERMGIGKKPTETGTAAQTSGPSGDWQAAVATAVRANIVYVVPPELSGNPEAIFAINLLPSGELLGRPRLVKSSGIEAYDKAVERAIIKTDPLPRPKNGVYPRALELSFRPKD